MRSIIAIVARRKLSRATVSRCVKHATCSVYLTFLPLAFQRPGSRQLVSSMGPILKKHGNGVTGKRSGESWGWVPWKIRERVRSLNSRIFCSSGRHSLALSGAEADVRASRHVFSHQYMHGGLNDIALYWILCFCMRAGQMIIGAIARVG